MKWRTGVIAGVLCCLLAVQASAFSDVGDDHWAAPGITRWSENGIVNGYEDGSFRPSQIITRGEMAALLSGVFSWNDTAENSFSDLPADRWYTGYMLKAAAAGVMQGSGGMARPEAAITRQEAAVMYYRAFGLTAVESEMRFPDSDRVAPWAQEAVNTLLAMGWIQGTETGAFEPEKLLTRAQAVTMLDNMVADYIDRPGAIQREETGTVLVASAGTTLQNMTVEGDLIITGAAVGSEVVLRNVTVSGRILVLAGKGSEVRISGTTSASLLEVRGTNSWVVLSDAPQLERILITGARAAVDGLKTGTAVEIGDRAEGAQVNGHVCEPGTVVSAEPGSSLGGIHVDVSTDDESSQLPAPVVLSKGADGFTIQVEAACSYCLRDESGNVVASYTAEADGTYTFTGLARGEYFLTAEKQGYEASEPVSIYVANGMVIIDWGTQGS